MGRRACVGQDAPFLGVLDVFDLFVQRLLVSRCDAFESLDRVLGRRLVVLDLLRERGELFPMGELGDVARNLIRLCCRQVGLDRAGLDLLPKRQLVRRHVGDHAVVGRLALIEQGLEPCELVLLLGAIVAALQARGVALLAVLDLGPMGT